MSPWSLLVAYHHLPYRGPTPLATFSSRTTSTIPTQPPLYYPTVSRSTSSQLTVPLWFPTSVVTSLPLAASRHLQLSLALSHHLKHPATPCHCWGTRKSPPWLVDREIFHSMLLIRRRRLAFGQVPLSLVRSLLDLPQPRSARFTSLSVLLFLTELSLSLLFLSLAGHRSRRCRRIFGSATMITPTFPPLAVPIETCPSSSLLFGSRQQ